MTQKITPMLWYDTQLEEAFNLYVSIFKDAKIIDINKGPDGKAFTGTIEIFGQRFMALNGGPQFKFTEAISLFVSCKDQAEVDRYWSALTADGGAESMCGWCKDKFGVSWQIVPDRLMQLLNDADPGRRQRATQAMLQMQKIDVAKLEAAAAG